MRAFLVAATVLPLLFLTPLAAAQDGPAEVGVGIYLLSIGAYDAHTGTFDADMYLWFEWDPAAAPDGFTPAGFEFVNGAASATLLDEETDPATGVMTQSYRVGGTFHSHVDVSAFPFDREKLELILEDGKWEATEIVYVPLGDETGLSPDIQVGGWMLDGHELTTRTVEYPFDESYSRIDLVVEMHRTSLSSVLNTFFPPLSFIILAALTFFIGLDSLVERIGAATAALISAVLFQAQIEEGIPFSAELILFDRVMLVIYVFILGTLAVSAFAPIMAKRRGEEAGKRANERGAAVVVGATALLALVIAFV